MKIRDYFKPGKELFDNSDIHGADFVVWVNEDGALDYPLEVHLPVVPAINVELRDVRLGQEDNEDDRLHVFCGVFSPKGKFLAMRWIPVEELTFSSFDNLPDEDRWNGLKKEMGLDEETVSMLSIENSQPLMEDYYYNYVHP